MPATWAALEGEWDEDASPRPGRSPKRRCTSRSNGEWSFVETLRHLVFAMDKWFTAPVLGAGFHPIGLPNTGSVDFPWPDLDHDLTPSVSEALAVRADRAARFRDFLATVDDDRLRPARSTCSRTARTRCRSASSPCSRRSSGTTATPAATSSSSRRELVSARRDAKSRRDECRLRVFVRG